MSPATATNGSVANGTHKTTTALHPLAPLSAAEIVNACNLVRTQWPEGTELHFKSVMLEEPSKDLLIPWLDKEAKGESLEPIDRRAWISYYLKRTNKFHEAHINLSKQKVESNFRLGANLHGSADGGEIIEVEKLALADEGVKKELEKLKLPDGAMVVSDPWTYGADGAGDDERMYQIYLYLRDTEDSHAPDSNHYALPLPISPVVSAQHMKVIRIDRLPTGPDMNVGEPKPFKVRPGSEYVPEKQKLRTDVKPLHVVQPEGASFKVTEQGTSNLIEWQKWSVRVGYNQREGPVLYNVRYDNRPLFHRVSLSDMNIPYADPRHPYHRKSAFDLGDAGAGIMANDLKLGCDCLGAIHYLSAVVTDHEGGTEEKPNVVCIHEQDGGIGWKHMNYRTNRAAVTRNRELVIQCILTVANYEYVLAFIFNQAAEMHYEVRATGILSTQPIDDGVDVPFGTLVHPGVLAVHHQHLFSLRIDPCIDGPHNRLVYSEAHPIPRDPKSNPYGNGYEVRDTTVQESSALDVNPDTNRTFKIINEADETAQRNPVNGYAPGYKLHLPPFQKILSDPSSFNHARAEFGDHNLYAVLHRPDELYAGGKYTNQSRGGSGVRSWAERRDNIVDKDLVLFAQFGLQHVTRVEDFPVMPSEVIRLALKPVNFFAKNPALDVPPSEQSFNQSVLLNGNQRHRQSAAEGEVGANGTVSGAVNGNRNGGIGPCH